jgi:disulfide bond formation protein DsbB
VLPRGDAADRAARWLALLIPAGLLGGAYLSEYGFGLWPCEMCWWQRYPHMAAIALALLGLLRPAARSVTALAAAALLISGLIGFYHAGVEYGWFPGLTACTSEVAIGGDALEAILNAPMVRCDQVQWEMLGISLAGFNFLFSAGGALLIFALLRRGRGAAR